MNYALKPIVSGIIGVILVFLLVRRTKNIERPFNKALKAIFFTGLAFYLLSIVFGLADNPLSFLLLRLSYLLIGGAIIILLWEEFKRSYREVIGES